MTRETVARKLAAYLHHELSLNDLVDWAQLAMTVMVAEIDEVPVVQKPCFYKSAGLPKGAYLRVGNTNRQMTEYEVFGYLSSRG